MSETTVVCGLVVLFALTWCVAATLSSYEDVVTRRVVHTESTTGLRALGEREKGDDVSVEEDSLTRKQSGSESISATMTSNKEFESRKEQQIFKGRTEPSDNGESNRKSEVKRNMRELSDHTYIEMSTDLSLRLVAGDRENEESTRVAWNVGKVETSSTVMTESIPSISTNMELREHSFITTPSPQGSEADSSNFSSSVSPVPTKHGLQSEVKRPFDLYDRNLPCAKADNLTRPASTSRCEFEWTEGPELPLVRCELVATLDKFGGHLYNSGWFSASCDERTESGRLCLRPVAYTIRRREALGALGSSVLPTDPLIQVLRSEGARSLLAVVTSHGFRESELRLRPDAIGPRGLLNADPPNHSNEIPSYTVVRVIAMVAA